MASDLIHHQIQSPYQSLQGSTSLGPCCTSDLPGYPSLLPSNWPPSGFSVKTQTLPLKHAMPCPALGPLRLLFFLPRILPPPKSTWLSPLLHPVPGADVTSGAAVPHQSVTPSHLHCSQSPYSALFLKHLSKLTLFFFLICSAMVWPSPLEYKLSRNKDVVWQIAVS